MSNSIVTAPTQFLQTPNEKYAYRRFGKKSRFPLLFLQHFTGTLDNWDPAVTDPLAADHDVILFENAGVGRSTGKVPTTMAEMAQHALHSSIHSGSRRVMFSASLSAGSSLSRWCWIILKCFAR